MLSSRDGGGMRTRTWDGKQHDTRRISPHEGCGFNDVSWEVFRFNPDHLKLTAIDKRHTTFQGDVVFGIQR
jgi:hypothetical protein